MAKALADWRRGGWKWAARRGRDNPRSMSRLRFPASLALAAVLAACLIALGLGAVPAVADNGPHVKGAGVLADGCADCHRVHTAKTDMMTRDTQPQLCYTCHGASGTGAAGSATCTSASSWRWALRAS